MEKMINVVAAAFIKNGKIFAVRRSYGSEYVIHKYEFVGGKCEAGEGEEEALARECLEELNLKIKVLSRFASTAYAYPDKRVNLSVYFCKMLSEYALKEHEEARWIPLNEIDPAEWAPADGVFFEKLRGAEFTFEDGFAASVL